MEFTEVQELNNIALQARSFMPGQFLPTDNPTLSSYRDSTAQSVIPALMFDYEKALEDTPPGSPSKYFTVQNSETLKLLEKDKEESVEDLLFSIKNSIMESTAINEFSITPTLVEQVEEQYAMKAAEISVQFEQRDGNIEQKEAEENNEPQNFEKITEDFVSKSYMETKNLKSFLSSSIKAFPMNKEYNTARRAEMKTFKVYFLSEKYSTLLPISFALPIRDIIKQCLETFKLNKAIADGPMKYPDRPDAYDLQRDLAGGPLDKQKTLKDIKIGRELFVVESKGFDASKPYSEANEAKNNNQTNGQNTLMVVTLILPTEDRARLTMQIGSEKQLKDIFSRLALEGKAGFNMQQYNLRLYSDDPETRWKEAKNFLDTNIPIKNIKQNGQEGIQIEFVKKKFADEPSEALGDQRASASPVRKSTGTINNDEQQIFLYNEVSANHYEEFEVTKINENGKKQERILGIDGFKLYNYTKSYKQEKEGRIGEIFNTIFLSKFGTMNPERLLTDVTEAKIIGTRVFQIGVKSEGRTKSLCFEAADSKTANQIVAKIKYLKGIQDKKNI